MFKVGDIIEKKKSPIDIDPDNELIQKYGRLTFLVMDILQNHVAILGLTYSTYKLLCMQTDEVSYRSMNERGLWKKIG